MKELKENLFDEASGITVLSDNLEKAKIISRGYDSDCYLKWFTDENDSMNKYIVKETKNNYKVLRLSSGEEVALEMSAPQIHSTMWYDDEYDAPERTFENFKEYNLHTLREFDINVPQFLISTVNKYNDDAVYYTIEVTRRTFDLGYNQTVVRELTEAEKKFIGKLYEENKERFIKRLETYFKKYSDHIYASGYWRDR